VKGEDDATPLHFIAKYKKKKAVTAGGDDEVGANRADVCFSSCAPLSCKNWTPDSYFLSLLTCL